MDVTPRLSLPYIASQQAQKQVTYNQAMRLLDILVQPVVRSRVLADPPGAPAEGDVYLVAAAAGGGWTGKSGQLAAFIEGGWLFRPTQNGWLLFVEDESLFIQRQAGSWVDLGSSPAFLGVNASADLTHRLAVASPASRFSHEGSDHRLFIDKATAIDTASQIFQSGGSGRAEVGLLGDNDLQLKVSADGMAWSEVLRAGAATGELLLSTGRLAFPATRNPSSAATTLDDYREGTWAPGLAFAGANTGITYDAATVGRYTRIGRLCLASFQLKLTSKGSATGAAQVTGLPYATPASGPAGILCTGMATGFAGVGGAVQGIVSPGSSVVTLYGASGGAAVALSNSHLTNSSLLQGVVLYDTD